jgi:hypothetical protein
MSGTAYSSWALMNKRTLDVRNRKLSTATNCPLSSSQEYVDCLRKMDGRVLSRKIGRIFVRKASATDSYTYRSNTHEIPFEG